MLSKGKVAKRLFIKKACSLKASKQIPFANSSESLFEHVYLSTPELRISISTSQTKRKITPKPKHKFVCKVFKRE